MVCSETKEYVIRFEHYVSSIVKELNKAVANNDARYFEEVVNELAPCEKAIIFSAHQHIQDFNLRHVTKTPS